jgi:hypothetical protein
VAERSGDTLLLAQAREVQGRIDDPSGGFLVMREAAIRDAADPEAPVAMELFEDDKLPFAVRVEILYAVTAGSCRNTREVLFGFAPGREARLQALATQYRDDAHLGAVLQLMPPAARRVREDPVSLLPRDRWPTGGTLDVLLPEATAARAVLCQREF